jgi:hypothetical protein
LGGVAGRVDGFTSVKTGITLPEEYFQTRLDPYFGYTSLRQSQPTSCPGLIGHPVFNLLN